MDLYDGLVILGCMLITVGVGLLSLPGGLIVGGMLMAASGVVGAAKKGAARKAQPIKKEGPWTAGTGREER